ncbi:uncharacterized protein LOC132722756 [Ruditapes philippinarum]|uniref:uncharacterized protein LOC132722756 n=1 Tax=Ruditapes philippinarum TaxID=129788 RepID=UPI00295C0D64|nr:uncharacterized protein LOC132722756 [Ruditapes philippinarum]
MSVESKRLNPDYPAMEQEYSDTNDFAPSCSTGQGFGGGLRDSYSSARGGSSFESRGGGFRGRDSPRHDRGGRGDFGSPGRSGDRPMGGSYGVDRRGPPQRHSSMDRSYSDRAQPAMRRGKQIVPPVVDEWSVQPTLTQNFISVGDNSLKVGPDARQSISKARYFT